MVDHIPRRRRSFSRRSLAFSSFRSRRISMCSCMIVRSSFCDQSSATAIGNFDGVAHLPHPSSTDHVQMEIDHVLSLLLSNFIHDFSNHAPEHFLSVQSGSVSPVVGPSRGGITPSQGRYLNSHLMRDETRWRPWARRLHHRIRGLSW